MKRTMNTPGFTAEATLYSGKGATKPPQALLFTAELYEQRLCFRAPGSFA